MSLASKLAGLPPKEHDTYLVNLWNRFRGSEEWEALVRALTDIETEAQSALLSPRANPYERAHAAGQVTATRRLLATAKAAATFDPQTADYSSSDTVADDEDIPADPNQRI